MNAYIRAELMASVKESMGIEDSREHGHLKELYAYLDDQLEILYDNLYPEVFKKVLQAVWQAINMVW